LGLVLDEHDGKISVGDVIAEMSSAVSETKPETGDQLIKIQSLKINSVEELTQVYGKIGAGEKAELTMLRNGKEVVLQFEKPESNPGAKPVKIIQKQGNQ
jgi:hypothetical protein